MEKIITFNNYLFSLFLMQAALCYYLLCSARVIFVCKTVICARINCLNLPHIFPDFFKLKSNL